jgi:peptidoglycan hydrolase-like protein with peptidoglycan-binding domain
MSLQSKLFRGESKPEAAAVSDPAHSAIDEGGARRRLLLTPGTSGPHVAKIQQALNVLDGAAIAQDGKYGGATAAAVLAYKRKRNIINIRYETQVAI